MKRVIRRNHVWGIILSLLLLFLVLSLPDSFLESEEETIISSVSSLGIPVQNIEKMTVFYTQAFGFKKIKEIVLSSKHLTKIFGGEGIRLVTLQLGANEVTLMQDLNQDANNPETKDSIQQITILVKDLPAAEAKLKLIAPGMDMKRLTFEKGKNKHAVHLLLLRDIEGNLFQLMEEKNVSKNQPLFFRISHTSLLVDDLDQAYAFYHDLLGLELQERGVYQGPYPLHKSWVDAKFQTMKFSSPKGPSIEVLKPTSPLNFPKDYKGDIWFAKLLSPRIYILKNLLKMKKNAPPEISNVHSPKVDFKQAMLIRDPNGHPILIAKP